MKMQPWISVKTLRLPSTVKIDTTARVEVVYGKNRHFNSFLVDFYIFAELKTKFRLEICPKRPPIENLSAK